MTLTIYQKVIIVLVLVVFTVLMYEEIFHLVIETIHVLFESVEYVLDFGIEHLFETGTHETQVIVFYLLVSAIFGVLYLLCRFFLYGYRRLKGNLHRQKIETLAQWQAISVFRKIAWWLFLIAVIGCGLFFTLM